MDLGIVAAAVMLIGWAIATFVMNDAPGWVHAFLTAGVFLLIYRIVARGTPKPPKEGAAPAGDRTPRG
ncbi:MAG: DUF5670 family protein [Gemmatimonadaceae bacterium]|jgi:uncharacterized membrane protein